MNMMAERKLDMRTKWLRSCGVLVTKDFPDNLVGVVGKHVDVYVPTIQITILIFTLKSLIICALLCNDPPTYSI